MSLAFMTSFLVASFSATHKNLSSIVPATNPPISLKRHPLRGTQQVEKHTNCAHTHTAKPL